MKKTLILLGVAALAVFASCKKEAPQDSPAHFIVNPEGPVEVTKEGGEFTITISTNCEFELKDYHDGSFPWQSAVLSEDKKTATVTIGANTGYDPRQSYVKFTIPAIQVPALDEEGAPTGETNALDVRVYFNQAGLTTISWTKTLPETFKNGTQLSMAKLGDNYFLYDGVSEPQKFNPSTGEITSAGIIIPGGLAVTEVFNDDAGNFLVATPVAYGSAFDVYVLEAGDTNLNDAEILIHAYFDYYGYGLGHFHARGDVLNDGIVTALIADDPAIGVPVTGAYWEISDGKATTWAKYGETEEQTCQPTYITFTTAGGIYSPNMADFAPLGTSAAAGFLYDGHDGTYALQHYVGGTTTPLATIGDRANGVTCIKTDLWGSKPIVALNNMSYFPQDAIPSKLTVYDATEMTPITTVEILAEGLEGAFMPYPHQSSCVLLEQKGDALIVYSADGVQGLLQKIEIPAAN